MSQAQPGNATHLPPGREIGTLFPNLAAAELGLDAKPMRVPAQHPQGLTPPCGAEALSWPSSGSSPSQQGQGSFWPANSQSSQVISSLSQSTALNSTPQPAPHPPRAAAGFQTPKPRKKPAALLFYLAD